MLENFRSQARVIDLLGREQIADSPTAIGELFKNALDAGARNAWVDFNSKETLLAIRDDGIGMRPDDVKNKWLVLATDSSHQSHEAKAEWAKHADENQRLWLEKPRYGEKGIGRLSVSILGRYTLLWTVWGEGKEKVGTLCLVHWHLFRHPRKLFEDLPIPCTKHTKAATQKDIDSLFKSIRDSPQIKSLLKDKDWCKELQAEVVRDLDQVPPIGLLNPGCDNLPWETGTNFHVLGISDEVPDLFEKRNRSRKPEEDSTAEYLKAYHAFATFWDPFHHHDGKRDFHIKAYVDGKALSELNRFWHPEDFTRCDHHICIEVSAEGFAQGTLKNYGQPEIEYKKQLVTLPPRHNSPGAFTVEIGYLQGTPSLSKLPTDDYKEIAERLEHSGGFSVYLNNVRIQPYGSIDNDFAGFEARRLKNAGRYYFASRRMFGGIFHPGGNTALREKAGREGFIGNGARRALRLWIEDLFIDLADSHYGRNAERPDKVEAKRKREHANRTKDRLTKEKKSYLLHVREANKTLAAAVLEGKSQVKAITKFQNSEHNGKSGTFLQKWEEKLEALRALGQNIYNTPDSPPIGVILEGDENSTIEIYRSKRAKLIEDLNKKVVIFSKELEIASSKHRNNEDHLDWLRKRILLVPQSYRQEINKLINPILEQNKQVSEKITKIGNDEYHVLETVYKQELGDLTPEKIAADTTNKKAQLLEQAIVKAKDHFEEVSKPKILELANELHNLLENTSATVIVQQVADEVTRLKERERYLIEMAQLGLITETATHEHEHHVGQVRRNITNLRKKLSGPNLNRLEQLSSSFNIVDARMRMFDPLVRRQGSNTVQLTGEEIEVFLREHFAEAFETETIEITANFKKTLLESVKTPIILGAIYNLVHNALYWSQRGDAENHKPKVQLSAAGSRLSVSDNGPGVSPRDIERIFDPGFSRRPYGRGLGLFIARQALEGIGYQLGLCQNSDLDILTGASFIIQPKSSDAN